MRDSQRRAHHSYGSRGTSALFGYYGGGKFAYRHGRINGTRNAGFHEGQKGSSGSQLAPPNGFFRLFI